jgi:bifunctional enzyme CysN/CysC
MTPRDTLHVLACGSVDDGKSTLIGRLLFDCGQIPDDVLAGLAADSRRHGTVGDALDFALLLDGLEAERAQGITIDVAYRHFATPRRRFVVADAPGHVQYTRNMATGASNADLAVLLVDARHGIGAQTRRHAQIAALMGIRSLVLAVNKMDLVGFDQGRFAAIAADGAALAVRLGVKEAIAIPVVARDGDNLVARSARMPWHAGPTLLQRLETATLDSTAAAALPLRYPVQYVCRPEGETRFYAGTLAAGRVAVGDRVAVARSGRATQVVRILTPAGEQSVAEAGTPAMLALADQIDLARGDLLVDPRAAPEVATEIVADLVWLDDAPLVPGQGYLLRIGHGWVPARVETIAQRIDPETLAAGPAERLDANDIARCRIATSLPVAFDPYAVNRATGAFILVDRASNATAAAGMILGTTRRASDVRPMPFAVDKAARARLAGQRPLVLWFTGLSGAGKSTIADLVEQALHRAGRQTYALDGDNLRHGLCADLGFTAADRAENIRRAGAVAKLMADAGLIVLCSFVSPYRAERERVRRMLPEGEFLEIFVDAPLATCAARDPKGLYARARAGTLSGLTGIDSPYEPPEAPDLVLPSAAQDAAGCAALVLARLRALGVEVG